MTLSIRDLTDMAQQSEMHRMFEADPETTSIFPVFSIILYNTLCLVFSVFFQLYRISFLSPFPQGFVTQAGLKLAV